MGEAEIWLVKALMEEVTCAVSLGDVSEPKKLMKIELVCIK